MEGLAIAIGLTAAVRRSSATADGSVPILLLRELLALQPALVPQLVQVSLSLLLVLASGHANVSLAAGQSPGLDGRAA